MQHGSLTRRNFIDADMIESMRLELYHRKTIHPALDLLISAGWIHAYRLPVEQAVAFCQSKRRPLGMDGHIRCVWRQANGVIIYAHHYPIPRFAGGTTTLQICDSYHAEFHDLVGRTLYRATRQPYTAIDVHPLSSTERMSIGGMA